MTKITIYNRGNLKCTIKYNYFIEQKSFENELCYRKKKENNYDFYSKALYTR